MSKTTAKRPAEIAVPAPLLPADSEESQLTLRLREYLKQDDIDSIWAAYRFSAAAHEARFAVVANPTSFIRSASPAYSQNYI